MLRVIDICGREMMSLSLSPFLSLQLGDFSFPLSLFRNGLSDARVTAADSGPRLIFSPMARRAARAVRRGDCARGGVVSLGGCTYALFS